jgi:hypothetical protein
MGTRLAWNSETSRMGNGHVRSPASMQGKFTRLSGVNLGYPLAGETSSQIECISTSLIGYTARSETEINKEFKTKNH